MTLRADHIEKVFKTASHPSAAAKSRLAASWRRSLEHHRFDPGARHNVKRITEGEFSERQNKMSMMRQIAIPKLDMLYQLVGSSGCGVLLSDADGVVLDLRAADADQAIFESWGLSPGADWSESSEGTNGIGTCITEKRRVIIHRNDHFHARNTLMSCIDAPVFGPDGNLIGALDVSSARSDQTEAINRLIAAQVAHTARQIEVDYFRSAFPKARIIVVNDDDTETAMLLAVDNDDIVRGATRGARIAFGLDQTGPFRPLPASDLFGREDNGSTGFEKAERAAVVRALSRESGNVSAAARALGVGRATLYRRMKRLGLSEN